LGDALYGLGDRDKAIAAYRKGIEIEPHDAAAHFNLGELYYDLGEHDEAEKECMEAIRLDPTFTLSYLTLGSLHMDREHVADAIKYLELYLKMEKSPQAAEMVAEVKAVVEGLKEERKK
jgi:tetratricopeptide (TPR) repeat protein